MDSNSRSDLITSLTFSHAQQCLSPESWKARLKEDRNVA